LEIRFRDAATQIRELGSGPPILLVHGYPLDGAMWSGVARTLSARFRVLKPDLPGRGDTTAPATGSIEGHADFLEAILSALGTPTGLAGFSMGGYAALALAKRRPAGLAALALVDTKAGADDEAARAKREEAIATLQAQGVPAIAEAMVPRLLAPDSIGRGDLAERVGRIMQRQKAETVEADLRALRDRPDSTAFLPSIAVPTLVVVGELDALTPPAESEKMAAAIPGARLVTVPGAGHLTPMERPGAVASALGDFFAGVLGAGGVGQ
jgi:pimeloyl-ACP methyl ester carboxylesterase